MSRRLRRIVFTSAVVPLAVLIGLRSAWASYACSMTGDVAADCCCPAQPDDDHPADGAPRIEAGDCCDLTVADATSTTDVKESERTRGLDAPVRVGDARFAMAAGPCGGAAITHEALARPPPPRAPTYLVNCAILR